LSALGTGATLCEGRYRLDGVVGRGGMAVVWHAMDLQLEREVAIKIISDVLAGDPRFVARFEREARLAAGLSHPNLVKVFDYSEDDERRFLVMEYVPGGTLVEARGQALDVSSLARDLLDAVAHIHAAGIVHRDIKPANVLLGADGSPRLTDFGIARGDGTSGLTQTGQVLGTLRYIAPEVASGAPATPQSDLYALGVLLGELGGDQPEPLARLLPRLTATDPADRPRSAVEALAELDPTRQLPRTEGLPRTEALPATQAAAPADRAAPAAPRSRLPRQFALRRWQAIAAAGVLLALLVVVIVAASGGGSAKLDVTRTTLRPAPAGAPVDQQLDRLERIVRAAPQRD
jgi:serine/threonine protein kinase